MNDCGITFLFKERECEICKAKLPDYINHNGTLYPLLDLSNQYKNFLILETLTLDEEKDRYIFIVSLDNNRIINIGRGLENDIVLKDHSVSRKHCMFKIEGKKIFISDNNSKFGTLILVQVPSIRMKENLPLYIQVGRTFLKFKIKENDSIFSNCFCCDALEESNIFYYYMQNESQIKLNKTLINKNEDDNFYEEEKKKDLDEEIK
jgi:hypothetical protein